MSDEMTPTEAIVANAEYHGRLLTSISNLDYVASALEHQAAYVADLENQKVQSADRVLALNKRTKKERKEHETLRDSTARRLAHKLTGRKELYEAKESKEERHVFVSTWLSGIFLLTRFLKGVCGSVGEGDVGTRQA